jgi:hypothetical protein
MWLRFLNSRATFTKFVFKNLPVHSPDKPEPKRNWLVREITIPLFKKRTGVKIQITNFGFF